MPEITSYSKRPRLLILSKDIVDVKMGGSGMRNLEMARALSLDLDVTLAIPNDTELEVSGVKVFHHQDNQAHAIQKLAEDSDVILISGDLFERFPFFQNIPARLVVDLYDPFVLENLFYYTSEKLPIQESFFLPSLEITNRLSLVGDYFICGSERQRDFWLGVLTANGRINPRTFAQDPSLRSLIDVVGIGFPERRPSAKPILRNLHPAIPADAKIVLWGGGIWEWLDPVTLVKAWPAIIQQYPKARLIFLGTRHPNPNIPTHKIAEKTISLAAEIGEKDRTILFYEWLPYEEREALLNEADIGVILHPPHIETRFSIRTRVLDYFWARLPVLVSDGDVTSQWVSKYNVGRVVPPNDIQAVSKTICEMLEKPKNYWSAAYEPLSDVFLWSSVVEPLRRYCLEGEYAPDRELRNNLLAKEQRTVKLQDQVRRAYFIWRMEGLRVLMHRSWRYIQWFLSRP